MQRQQLARDCVLVEAALMSVKIALTEGVNDLGHAYKHGQELLMEAAELATRARRYHAAELLAGGRSANG